jgi:hypothetical protein
VHIGDVPSSNIAGMRVWNFPRRITTLNAAISILNIGKTLPIADPSMRELEGYILVMVSA